MKTTNNKVITLQNCSTKELNGQKAIINHRISGNIYEIALVESGKILHVTDFKFTIDVLN